MARKAAAKSADDVERGMCSVRGAAVDAADDRCANGVGSSSPSSAHGRLEWDEPMVFAHALTHTHNVPQSEWIAQWL